jgi:hypothetical protein
MNLFGALRTGSSVTHQNKAKITPIVVSADQAGVALRIDNVIGE